VAGVKVSPGALVQHARSDNGRKQLRYAAVSVVFVPIGQILIQILAATVFKGDENNFTWASITSAAILTLPNFFANRYLVWKVTSRDRLRTQVLVFWVAAMLGVTLATVLTYLVELQVHGRVSGLVEAICVFVAQLVGFGIVWVGRYLILDRWLFKVTHHGEEPDEDDLEMMHGDLPV
jgi:putative flippase GtrA